MLAGAVQDRLICDDDTVVAESPVGAPGMVAFPIIVSVFDMTLPESVDVFTMMVLVVYMLFDSLMQMLPVSYEFSILGSWRSFVMLSMVHLPAELGTVEQV